jgi:hypothetical protein
MNALLFLVCLIVLINLIHGFGGNDGGMPGGWSFVDPRDDDVQRAANFAVQTRYPGKNPSFIVVLARKQVNIYS